MVLKKKPKLTELQERIVLLTIALGVSILMAAVYAEVSHATQKSLKIIKYLQQH